VACTDEGPAAVLDGLRAGRVAISGSRDGAVLLRDGDALVAVGADGLVLAGPDGPRRRVAGDLARLPRTPGYHRLLTPGRRDRRPHPLTRVVSRARPSRLPRHPGAAGRRPGGYLAAR
jgi:hypothetical protein